MAKKHFGNFKVHAFKRQRHRLSSGDRRHTDGRLAIEEHSVFMYFLRMLTVPAVALVYLLQQRDELLPGMQHTGPACVWSQTEGCMNETSTCL